MSQTQANLIYTHDEMGVFKKNTLLSCLVLLVYLVQVFYYFGDSTQENPCQFKELQFILPYIKGTLENSHAF